MDREAAYENVRAELARAVAARSAGNEGMARVCARRGAGVAITWWIARHGKRGWGADAVRQLRRLEEEPVIPEHVRAAAGRLTTRVAMDFSFPFDSDPIEDSRLIADWLLQQGA
jgi:hypothetical protein